MAAPCHACGYRIAYASSGALCAMLAKEVPASKRSVSVSDSIYRSRARVGVRCASTYGASTLNGARRSINVSRGVISFSTDSCVKYQIKRAECLFKWSFVVAGVPWRRGGGCEGWQRDDRRW